MFENVTAYPGDPILSLLENFVEDRRPAKTNLSIGFYYDAHGQVPVLRCVSEAAAWLRANPAPPGYLPMEGSLALRQCIQSLVFGEACETRRAGRIATIQTIGGSGALHVAARFIKAFLPGSAVWISDPTWDNHRTLLESAGLDVHTYPYYDPVLKGVDVEAMLGSFAQLPRGSVILLQPSCHNPTGCDLPEERFGELIDLASRRQLIPFVDMAYQGFGDGPERDAALIRKMVAAGLPVFVSNSFSKNFSLYGERIGGLSIVCENVDAANRVQGQLKSIVRKVYSSPPSPGAYLVSAVLSTPRLEALWQTEIGAMRERIIEMRGALRTALERALGTPVPYLTEQRGMFSYTGLTADEVDYIRETHGVYLVRSGRMCVAGLNNGNVQTVARAFADAFARRGKAGLLTLAT
jgi:aromatic-amino-acid transaminase